MSNKLTDTEILIALRGWLMVESKTDYELYEHAQKNGDTEMEERYRRSFGTLDKVSRYLEKLGGEHA